jgi:hypothetical protein
MDDRRAVLVSAVDVSVAPVSTGAAKGDHAGWDLEAVVSRDDTPFKPNPEVKRQAVWGEAFADYERRTGLGDATGNAYRSQHTAGFLVGVDHAAQISDLGVMFGLIGGASDTRQQFQRGPFEQDLITNYVVDFSNSPDTAWQNFIRNGGQAIFSYPLPTNHILDSVQQQTLTGPSLGATLSFFRGGFFSDGVAKVDFLELNRNSVVSDLFARTLNAVFSEPLNPISGNQAGCIIISSLGVPVRFPPPLFYTLTNPTATITDSIQNTSAINFIVAENLGYHFNLPLGYWIEPTIGARYSYSTYGSNAASLGLEDGHAVRVQGGARLGFTGIVPGTYVWTTSLTAFLYSDVWISGFVTNADGFSAGALLADEGKLRVQGILASKVSLLNGFSAFGEVQGRYGQDYFGAGGRIGARYEW